MPTYEYKCTKCGHTFEAVQHMTDKPLSRCPECKGAVRRIIGGGMGVIFKGSGFYSTDNRKGAALTSGNGGNGGNGGSKDREKSGEKAGEKAGEKSGEKPAEKPAESARESSTATEKKPAS